MVIWKVSYLFGVWKCTCGTLSTSLNREMLHFKQLKIKLKPTFRSVEWFKKDYSQKFYLKDDESEERLSKLKILYLTWYQRSNAPHQTVFSRSTQYRVQCFYHLYLSSLSNFKNILHFPEYLAILFAELFF